MIPLDSPFEVLVCAISFVPNYTNTYPTSIEFFPHRSIRRDTHRYDEGEGEGCH